ncbi:MAG TPA: CheR family methyltransferase, partial [Thermoanaerobaculia bacterium]|nr:CheR family methyltransferase [Thermoanaerobaculia bacterium]
MAFIFIQHSAPHRQSLLTDILSRSARMPIHEVEKGMRVEPDHGYVAPPGMALDVKDGRFDPRAQSAREREGSIDSTFERLAEAYGSRLVGIVLSGSLSDGAVGLHAIKAAGGVTFAQTEESARYPSMPHAAAAGGYVDLVLSPKEIARRLPEIVKHPFVKNGSAAAKPSKAGDHQKILTMLRLSTGVNFSLYRQTTVKRRIHRRMVLHKIDDVSQYAVFLRENAGELAALYEDILITVTSFFRDPETFETLQKKVFPGLFAARAAPQPVRVWVPGCATGEEAYSLAIALMETASEQRSARPIQLFGTDISERAIEKARGGIYSEGALENVSPERRRRFFNRVASGYQVARTLRDACVFARQNVGTDPPFGNLDLLSCRNLLIYLEPPLQDRVLRFFHYALKPTGFLVLGASESIGSFEQLFAPLDRQRRVFTKIEALPGPLAEMPRAATTFPDTARRAHAPEKGAPATEADIQRRVDRLVLGAYAPPGVLLDDAFDILQFRGKTSPYLESSAGTPSLNVLKMAREGLVVELRAALAKARKTGERVRVEDLLVKHDDHVLPTDVEVVPVKEPASDGKYFLVLFEPAKEREKRQREKVRSKAGRDAGQADSVARLERELAATKEYLESVIEAQQASNEELKSANEEILSANEELQSTNEELETTKEELQSTNEELSIVNEELHTRNEELRRTYNDVSNLVQGLDLAVVMLAGDGTIRLMTSVAERLLDLKNLPAGRRLSDVKSPLVIPDLPDLVARTMETVQLTEREVQAADGHFYLLRVRPYRTSDNRIEGVVLAFLDIDPLKRSMVEMRLARDYAESVLETVKEILVVLDGSLRIQSANGAFHETFHTSRKDLAGTPILELPP